MPLEDLYSSPMTAAQSMLGKAEQPNREELADYLRTGGQNLDPATTAWCAAFVNASLAKAGRQGTGALNARSFLDWGQAVDKPQPGDIAVFSRGDPNGWQGHVGFFQDIDPATGRINVLGGNQGDSVSVAGFDPGQLLGYRRDPSAGPQTPNFNPAVPTPAPTLGLDEIFASAAPRRPQAQAREERGAEEQRRRAALFEALPGLG